jgi:hypothetical protein
MSDLLIKFPTRARPEKFFTVLEKYRAMLSGKHSVFFLITCDISDITMNNDAVRSRIAQMNNVAVYFGESANKIAAVNMDMDKAPPFSVLLLASDDMIPMVQGYDDVICSEMAARYPDTDGVLWFFDGHNRNTDTLAILGKKFYDRFGYIYNPEYVSLWCDDEMVQVSKMLGKLTFIDRVIIEHQHPSFVPIVYDELYRKNDTYATQDEQTFRRRHAIKFGLQV